TKTKLDRLTKGQLGIVQHGGEKNKNIFETNLTNYAKKQMAYNDNEVMKNLEEIAEEFLALVPTNDERAQLNAQDPQKMEKEHLLKIERYLVGYYATWIIDIGLKARLFDAI